ncbi:hypothetical protein PF007_g19551 [Phytophthora fragariae]|uniref:Uncharacterized protein n=1 Tax=Phytophthora fragariae TaxID=53985 RepID=A0A6A3R4K5_9STRA|nr:hypothetical protein PF007_g19551 [Phytophthora fragariae]KAE9265945.1 hypothetical protein PF001_g30682 [Phytophthora fragariae]
MASSSPLNFVNFSDLAFSRITIGAGGAIAGVSTALVASGAGRRGGGVRADPIPPWPSSLLDAVVSGRAAAVPGPRVPSLVGPPMACAPVTVAGVTPVPATSRASPAARPSPPARAPRPLPSSSKCPMPALTPAPSGVFPVAVLISSVLSVTVPLSSVSTILVVTCCFAAAALSIDAARCSARSSRGVLLVSVVILLDLTHVVQNGS